MSLAPVGVLDLFHVTKLLVDMVEDYWTSAPLWSTLTHQFTHKTTGMAPDGARQANAGGGCQVTLTLIHIEPSKFNRNYVYSPTPAGPNPPPGRAQGIPALPLALDLFYFVTAWSDAPPPICSFEEQVAISIVLNCFHQNPIIRANVVFPGSPEDSVPEEFTLTMEIESVDSISRFWQATTVPFRLSVMYRVAVVFLTPPAPAPIAKQVSRVGLAIEPTSFPFVSNGQLFGTSSTTTFTDPNSVPGNPQSVSVDYSPATVTPGQRFFLCGAGLNQGTDYSGPPPNPGTSYRVYLQLPSDYTTEEEVTVPWKVLDSGSPGAAIQTSSRIVLDLPAGEGSPPASTPPAGIYALVVGSDAGPDAITYRTNSTPFNIAARVDAPVSPAIPILTDVGGTYTVTGMGFIAGSTEVLLETVPLSAVAGPPGAGEFTVVDISTITFQTPANLPSGLYSVRIRVNGVESPPAVWIKF